MLYEKFLTLCKEAGVKPETVKLQSKISSTNFSKMKKGEDPSAKTIEQIAEYFGVTVKQLTE